MFCKKMKEKVQILLENQRIKNIHNFHDVNQYFEMP